MAIHGSSNPASQDGTHSPSTGKLGTLTDPRRILNPMYRGPHRVLTPGCCLMRLGRRAAVGHIERRDREEALYRTN